MILKINPTNPYHICGIIAGITLQGQVDLRAEGTSSLAIKV